MSFPPHQLQKKYQSTMSIKKLFKIATHIIIYSGILNWSILEFLGTLQDSHVHIHELIIIGRWVE